MSTEDTTKFDEARAYAAAMRRMHLWVGADIIDSLVEENEKLRQAARLSRSIADEYSAERDALRAQLDSMTKRHASALGAISRVRSVVMSKDGDYLDGADFDGLAGEVQNALGPWVEVSE